jgi:hypothetical protein
MSPLTRKKEGDKQRENMQRWTVKLTGYKTRNKEWRK